MLLFPTTPHVSTRFHNTATPAFPDIALILHGIMNMAEIW
jgi:hypothetical protein